MFNVLSIDKAVTQKNTEIKLHSCEHVRRKWQSILPKCYSKYPLNCTFSRNYLNNSSIMVSKVDCIAVLSSVKENFNTLTLDYILRDKQKGIL